MGTERKTLGSLSVPDLLDSAQSELDGLAEFIERVAKLATKMLDGFE